MSRIKNPKSIKQSKCGIIYGENGHGKTHWALTGGKTLLIDLNGEQGFIGSPNLDNVDVEVISSQREMDTFMSKLPQMVKGYELIIVDNITQLQTMKASNINFKTFKEWAVLNNYIIDTVAKFKEECKKQNVDIFFLAHQSRDEEREEQIGDLYCSTVFPYIRSSVAVEVMGMMDIIFHVFISVEETEDKDGNDILKPTYKVHLGLHDTFKTKCRGKKPPREVINQDKISLQKLLNYLKK